jgi:hypothetical protein
MTPDTKELVDRALELLEKPMETTTTTTKEFHTYHLEIPDDIHWILVALGAGSRQHEEDYAEKILIDYGILCYERMAAMYADETQEEK